MPRVGGQGRQPAIQRHDVRPTPRESESEIFRTEAGALRNPNEHARAKFVLIVEGKHEIRPARP
jgi:hypothetical protein